MDRWNHLPGPGLCGPIRRERMQHKTPKHQPAPLSAEAFTLGDAATLARQLAAAIQRQGFSKADAAAIIGISRETLRALLKGKPTRPAARQRASAWLHTLKRNTDA
jgi:DNA-binding NtrC family response regulator